MSMREKTKQNINAKSVLHAIELHEPCHTHIKMLITDKKKTATNICNLISVAAFVPSVFFMNGMKKKKNSMLW